ncbi:atp-dependent rna helicase dbp6 [Gossypium arboreum]|uniref:Atp-dependent rna helicase dbp6 n=1 Tax=Gossypium arboreum TaxID=29729 RepID=A0A0B0P6T2_GOSAR|nr:atp-dependent rna helicase dbp6 [Gossypium arboreum]
MGIVETSDKACAPSSSTLRNKFFEEDDNDIPKENKENERNDVHIDGNDKKGKHLRFQLHVLKLEGRNTQRKLEGLQDYPVK